MLLEKIGKGGKRQFKIGIPSAINTVRSIIIHREWKTTEANDLKSKQAPQRRAPAISTGYNRIVRVYLDVDDDDGEDEDEGGDFEDDNDPPFS